MAIFELFEEIVVLQVFLGLFHVGLESGIKDAFNVGRGCGCGSLGHGNGSRRLTHVEGMRGIFWTREYWCWKYDAGLLSMRR